MIVSLLFVCLSVVIVPLLLIESYSEEIDRADIDKLKTKITDTNNKITLLETDIEKQKTVIIQNEIKFDNLKNELKTLKKNSDDSWTYIEKIMDAKNTVREAEKEIISSKDKLQLLFIEKSDNIRLIDELEEETDDVITLLRKQVDESETLQQDQNNSNSTGLVKKIGITLSANCIKMLKNNITTSCPTYEELYYLDSSIQNISGEFSFKDGFFQRLKPNMINSWNWYDFDNNLRIFVDPPSGMENKIKMIEIRPNFNTYIINGEKYQPQKYEDKNIEVTSHTNKTKTITVKVETQKQGRILFHDRYVDDYCKNAMINSDKWLELLDDTIQHMRNNCDEGSTVFNNMEFIPATKTEFNMMESPSWQALQWFEEAQKKCKELCLPN